MAAAPHLSCIGAHPRHRCARCSAKYAAHGIRHLVALRGDLPSGMAEAGRVPLCERARRVHARGDRRLVRHRRRVPTPSTTRRRAARRTISTISSARCARAPTRRSRSTSTTPTPTGASSTRAPARGITIPIVPGIMPIAQLSRLARFSDACGAEIPRWIRRKLEGYGDDTASVRAFGLDVVTDLCARLLERGAPGLHFYTLNSAALTTHDLAAAGACDGARGAPMPNTAGLHRTRAGADAAHAAGASTRSDVRRARRLRRRHDRRHRDRRRALFQDRRRRRVRRSRRAVSRRSATRGKVATALRDELLPRRPTRRSSRRTRCASGCSPRCGVALRASAAKARKATAKRNDEEPPKKVTRRAGKTEARSTCSARGSGSTSRPSPRSRYVAYFVCRTIAPTLRGPPDHVVALRRASGTDCCRRRSSGAHRDRIERARGRAHRARSRPTCT